MRLPVGIVGMVGIMNPPVGMGKIGGQVLEMVDPQVGIDTGISRLAGFQVGIGKIGGQVLEIVDPLVGAAGAIIGLQAVIGVGDIVDPLVCAAMNAWSAAVPHIDRGIALTLSATGVGEKAILVRTAGIHPLVQGVEGLGEMRNREDARVAHISVA